MNKLTEPVYTFDFFHCIEREGFVFTAVTEPANILDAIVIRNPANCDALSPKKAFSSKSLIEHIDFINKYKLEKACIIAENIDFITECPSLKYLHIIPAKTAPENFDYSPLYSMSEIKYLLAVTEYRDWINPTITDIDYSKISGLTEVWINGKGHYGYDNLNSLEFLSVSDSKLNDFTDIKNCKSLRKVNLLNTGIKTLNGISQLKNLNNLNLNYERRLTDVADIANISDNIKSLSIFNCPKITDFSFLEKLNNLEHLNLFGNNKLSNLNFLTKMPFLKTFSFSMEILDGDLSECLNIPNVWCKKGRKHYNLKDKDLPKTK